MSTDDCLSFGSGSQKIINPFGVSVVDRDTETFGFEVQDEVLAHDRQSNQANLCLFHCTFLLMLYAALRYGGAHSVQLFDPPFIQELHDVDVQEVNDRQSNDPGGKGLRDRPGSTCFDRQDVIGEPGERGAGVACQHRELHLIRFELFSEGDRVIAASGMTDQQRDIFLRSLAGHHQLKVEIRRPLAVDSGPNQFVQGVLGDDVRSAEPHQIDVSGVRHQRGDSKDQTPIKGFLSFKQACNRAVEDGVKPVRGIDHFPLKELTRHGDRFTGQGDAEALIAAVPELPSEADHRRFADSDPFGKFFNGRIHGLTGMLEDEISDLLLFRAQIIVSLLDREEGGDVVNAICHSFSIV